MSGPSISRTLLLFLVSLVILVQLPIVFPAVLGIDYGSDWFKIAAVRPNKPLDLILNRESKRKTHSLLTLRTDERFFGSDADALAPRFPSTTFLHLKSLLGKLANSTEVQNYASLFPVNLSPDPVRGTVLLEGMDNVKYSVEELVAMQLAHASSQAEESLQKPVKDVVITIPPFWNQAERQAMLTAAHLAGLRVLSLLHDETAVAINYAMSRQFPEPQHHIFYDMGAGSTAASLVKFETENRVTKVTVLAVGYDQTLGGLTVDALIADYLAKQFMETNKEKLKTPLLENGRARSKLLREAARIKVILSVNPQVQASIESLHEDNNLRVAFTRAELEDMISPLYDRVVTPLRTVLSSIPIDQVESLVLVGGGVRIPQVQRWLETEMGGSEKLAMNVNADEAAVLGATWRAGIVARTFRVQRNIQVQDGLPYTIAIGAKKTSPVFTPLAPMVNYKVTTPGVAKTVTIKKNEPLDLPLIADDLGKVIASIHTKPGNESVIDQKVTFQLDSSGLLTMTNATSTVLIEGSGGLLGIGKTEDTMEVIPLEAQLIESIPPLTGNALIEAETRLSDWNKREQSRLARENARNALESLVYMAKEKASDPDDNILKVATDQELEQIVIVAEETGVWLEETEEDSLTEEALHQKLQELNDKHDNVMGRWEKVQNWFGNIRDGMKQLNENSTWVDEYEVRDQYDMEEIETYAKDIQKRVEEKLRLEFEEKMRELTEKFKREEEAKRKQEADDLLRKAAEEINAKNGTESSESSSSSTESESIHPENDTFVRSDDHDSIESTTVPTSPASPSNSSEEASGPDSSPKEDTSHVEL